MRVGVVGLGVLGRAVAHGVLRRRDLDLVTVVDADPSLDGRFFDGARGPIIQTRIGDEPLDVVALLTASRVDAVGPTILELVERGVNVVTAAEELTYPWYSHPDWSARLDRAAQENGVSVLSIGANPGLLMDTLVTTLSLATQQVRRVTVTRTMDLRTHRAARLRRFGIGLTPEEFRALPATTLHGHIGFRQSIDALADAFGWRVDTVHEIGPAIAHVADADRAGKVETIPAGSVAVVEQSAIATIGGHERIAFSEYFGFVDPADPVPLGDSWRLEGVEHTISLEAKDGVHSFSTTPSTVVNMLRPVHDAPAGLRTAGDFPVRELAAKGG